MEDVVVTEQVLSSTVTRVDFECEHATITAMRVSGDTQAMHAKAVKTATMMEARTGCHCITDYLRQHAAEAGVQ